MGKIKRLVFLLLSGVSGLLLTLAGVNLIELSQSLVLYVGLVLLILSVLYYFLAKEV